MTRMINQVWSWAHTDMGDGILAGIGYLAALIALRWLMIVVM